MVKVKILNIVQAV